MKPVIKITSPAMPLQRSDVDTDQIIPAEWLKRVERVGFGEGLFSEWRKDPGFVLNNADYKGSAILIGGPNFGTGSSREHAVWALQDYGFEAIISSRFADIFRNNCTKVGVVPVQLEQSQVDALMQASLEDPGFEITVDVGNLTVSSALGTFDFVLDDFTQMRLLEGQDDIGLTMRHAVEIDEFESTRPDFLPSSR